MELTKPATDPTWVRWLISATLWHTPDGVREDDLYTALAGVVSRHWDPDSAVARVPIADSKSLYKSSGTLQALECGVLTALRALGLRPATWREAWAQAAPHSLAALDRDPWYADFELRLPLHHDSASLERLADLFLQGLRDVGRAAGERPLGHRVPGTVQRRTRPLG